MTKAQIRKICFEYLEQHKHEKTSLEMFMDLQEMIRDAVKKHTRELVALTDYSEEK